MNVNDRRGKQNYVMFYANVQNLSAKAETDKFAGSAKKVLPNSQAVHIEFKTSAKCKDKRKIFHTTRDFQKWEISSEVC